MRMIRALTVVVTLVTVISRPVAAQQGRSFKDAWFWGVKAGGFNYSTQLKSGATAPSVGADWLITRSRAGLLVGFDQIFFNQVGYMPALDSSGAVGLRFADLKNMRRFQVAAMVFPGKDPGIRPYAGLGFAFNQIAAVTKRGQYTSQEDLQVGESFIQSRRTSTTPIVIVGSQFRLPMFSAFVQGSASAMTREFFLSNRTSFNYMIEAGVRYNVGSSIDRM